jgi:hypothetical protein
MTTVPVCYGCYVDSIVFDDKTFESKNDESLTFEEKECLRLLSEAWKAFSDLGQKHPSDNPEFCNAIHDAQKLIGIRVARRVDPDIWTQY